MSSLKQFIKPFVKSIPLDERYLLKKDAGNNMFSVNVKGFPPLYFRKATTDTRVFNQIFYWKEYDFIPPSYVPDTIIDCGANIGMFTVWSKLRYPNAKIVCVEPSQGNFEVLKRNTENYDNVTLLNKGLWDKEANLEIVNEGDGEWQFHTIEVPEPTKDSISAISIDKIMQQHGIKEIGLLKIDIESAEKEVFEGNTDTWLPNVRVMVIEMHDRMKKGCTKAVFKALDKYQYDMEVSGENLVIFFHPNPMDKLSH